MGVEGVRSGRGDMPDPYYHHVMGRRGRLRGRGGRGKSGGCVAAGTLNIYHHYIPCLVQTVTFRARAAQNMFPQLKRRAPDTIRSM